MKSTRGEKIFYIVNNIVLALVALTCLLPLIYIISVSLSSSSAVMSGKVFLWPVEFSLESYDLIVQELPVCEKSLHDADDFHHAVRRRADPVVPGGKIAGPD